MRSKFFLVISILFLSLLSGCGPKAALIHDGVQIRDKLTNQVDLIMARYNLILVTNSNASKDIRQYQGDFGLQKHLVTFTFEEKGNDLSVFMKDNDGTSGGDIAGYIMDDMKKWFSDNSVSVDIKEMKLI